MAKRLLMRKWGDALRLPSNAKNELFAKIPDGDFVSVEIRTRRSEAQSDLYWSILTKAVASMNAANFAGEHWNKDKLHLALKLALGKYDLMELRGKAVPVPHSMADFSQKEQQEYFDEAMDMLCRDLLPKIGSDDLTAEIIGMLAPKEERAA